MIGSISKIRPCGHHHHYKYSSCVNVNDFSRVDRNYKSDIDENGLWYFNTDNAINCRELLRDSSNIVEVKLNLPKATNIDALLRYCVNLKSAKVEAPKITSVGTVIYDCIKLTNFEMDTSKIVYFSYFAEGSSLSRLKFGMGKATDMNNAFLSNHGGRVTASVLESSLNNVTKANNSFGGIFFTEAKYPIDENGNCVWDSKLSQHYINGEPQYKYLTLPNLTTGVGMFSNARFNKKTTISILESLPAYTSGSHPITIGIHVDHKYDPEVNLAIKKCQNSYITPIEELGSTLPEEITTDKGWTLSVQWNGTATENAYPVPFNPFIDEPADLPEGYTRCEYLKNTGTQYINTKYIPSNTTGLYVISQQLTHTNAHVMGSGHDYSSTAFLAPRWLKGTANGCGYGWKGWNAWGSIGNGSIFESYLNWMNDRVAKIKCNKGLYKGTLGNLGFTPTQPIYIFGTSYSGWEKNWNGLIYRAKISDVIDGEVKVIKDFVPCLDVNNKPCMYDVLGTGTVEENTYYSPNGNDFEYKLYENDN